MYNESGLSVDFEISFLAVDSQKLVPKFNCTTIARQLRISDGMLRVVCAVV